MQIKLNLFISVILEAVKAETQIKGRIDKATNPQAGEVAFNESAGDEQLHERKLLRGIYTSLDKLKVMVSDYLDANDISNADNVISSTINETTDSIEVIINVNRRFNTSLTDSLARLFSKFIEDNTLIYWWGAIGNQPQVQFYTALLADDSASINAIFAKRGHVSTTIPYTEHINMVGTSITMEVGDSDTISYSIDEGVNDDIAFRTDGCSARLYRKGGEIIVEAVYPGITHVKLFSVHDETVSKLFDVIVKSEDGTFPNTEHIRHI